jgi:23S rRNA pseudouridine2604 synthase
VSGQSADVDRDRPGEQRIAKLMAARGMCSRREAERLIAAGQVSVDGVVVVGQGGKARPDARIEIAAAGRETLGASLSVVLHKPIGVVSTQPSPRQLPAWKLLRRETAVGVPGRALERVLADPQSFAAAGRLDRASRGLLLLTQDGTLARRVIGGNQVVKQYLVRTELPATDGQVAKLNGRMRLDDRELLPMRVHRDADGALHFALREGRKQQIRRCCKHVGLQVVDLLRVAIGPVQLGDLPAGRWRLLTVEEDAALRGSPAAALNAAAPRPAASRRREKRGRS